MVRQVDSSTNALSWYLAEAGEYQPDFVQRIKDIMTRPNQADKPRSFLDFTQRYFPGGAPDVQDYVLGMKNNVEEYRHNALIILRGDRLASVSIGGVDVLLNDFLKGQLGGTNYFEGEVLRRVPEADRMG